jgi:pyrimidine-nucleoside phosphorylase/thymidine phosphorylase
MRPPEIIRKKRDGRALTSAEMATFVKGVTTGKWADYQASALLMACFLNGMSDDEQADLTREMLHSGEVLEWPDIDRPISDKHSTGGVGDKTSLVIAPLAAACGLCVPMISGRGLGHTGGTLDKLEAIPNYRVGLTLDEFRAGLKKVGFAMMGQTETIAPADRKLYALRDATATVEAIPLIVASIMSKKLAAGLGSLVLDVKTGSGAFMPEVDRARQLAQELVKTGLAFGVRTRALITDMNQPLGRAVGHAHEVVECLEILRGESDQRSQPLLDLSIDLTAHMLVMAGIEATMKEARLRVNDRLYSGEGLDRFRLNIEAQGGDPSVCDDPKQLLDLTLSEVRVESPRAGFVQAIKTNEIGHAISAIGGGRSRVDDHIDHALGYLAEAKLGDRVEEGGVLGLLHCRETKQVETAVRRLQRAYVIGDEAPRAEEALLIKEVIGS